jgi:NAD-dependent dihydropyrimidine dehydrogenase PreA subunit
MAVIVAEERCVGCGQCIFACPVGCIKVLWGKSEIDSDECVECLECIYYCPNDAIEEA